MNISYVLFNTGEIEDIIKNNPCAVTWFHKRRKFLGWVIALSGGITSSIRICSSNMFGLDLLAFNLSKHEKAQFEQYKLRFNVLFENVPQIILQIFYLSIDKGNTTEISIWFST